MSNSLISAAQISYKFMTSAIDHPDVKSTPPKSLWADSGISVHGRECSDEVCSSLGVVGTLEWVTAVAADDVEGLDLRQVIVDKLPDTRDGYLTSIIDVAEFLAEAGFDVDNNDFWNVAEAVKFLADLQQYAPKLAGWVESRAP